MPAETLKYLRSFGRIHSRVLTYKKQLLLSDFLPKLLFDLNNDFTQSSNFFSNKKQIWLEIGFGNGENIIKQAMLNNDIGIIGCEPFINGVAALLNEIKTKNFGNIKLFTDDARQLLAKTPASFFNRVFILFPDPWPKKRHHKRRIINTYLLEQLAKVVKRGGDIIIATDHDDYAKHILVHFINNNNFVFAAKNAQDWQQPSCELAKTRYQKKAEQQGRKSVFFRFIVVA